MAPIALDRPNSQSTCGCCCKGSFYMIVGWAYSFIPNPFLAGVVKASTAFLAYNEYVKWLDDEPCPEWGIHFVSNRSWKHIVGGALTAGVAYGLLSLGINPEMEGMVDVLQKVGLASLSIVLGGSVSYTNWFFSANNALNEEGEPPSEGEPILEEAPLIEV